MRKLDLETKKLQRAKAQARYRQRILIGETEKQESMEHVERLMLMAEIAARRGRLVRHG